VWWCGGLSPTTEFALGERERNERRSKDDRLFAFNRLSSRVRRLLMNRGKPETTPLLVPPALDLRRGRGVNHIGVIGGDLLVQTLGRLR
jgi:hypothetical protein